MKNFTLKSLFIITIALSSTCMAREQPPVRPTPPPLSPIHAQQSTDEEIATFERIFDAKLVELEESIKMGIQTWSITFDNECHLRYKVGVMIQETFEACLTQLCLSPSSQQIIRRRNSDVGPKIYVKFIDRIIRFVNEYNGRVHSARKRPRCT